MAPKAKAAKAATGKNPRKVAKPTKLRKSITPGTILILLSGHYRGKRVVFLKQLPSGLLLVTGPYAVNGVPLRRVNQRYVIATSTKVDVGKVNAGKFDDKYFARDKIKAKKGEDGFFAKNVEKTETSAARKADQKTVDGALNMDELMKKYLKARFALSSGSKPH